MPRRHGAYRGPPADDDQREPLSAGTRPSPTVRHMAKPEITTAGPGLLRRPDRDAPQQARRRRADGQPSPQTNGDYDPKASVDGRRPCGRSRVRRLRVRLTTSGGGAEAAEHVDPRGRGPPEPHRNPRSLAGPGPCLLLEAMVRHCSSTPGNGWRSALAAPVVVWSGLAVPQGAGANFATAPPRWTRWSPSAPSRPGSGRVRPLMFSRRRRRPAHARACLVLERADPGADEIYLEVAAGVTVAILARPLRDCGQARPRGPPGPLLELGAKDGAVLDMAP